MPQSGVVAARRRPADLRIGAGLAGLWLALAVRVTVAGVAGAQSLTAGLLFGALVAVVAAVTATRKLPTLPLSRAIGYGILGAVVLCVPAAIRHSDGVTTALPLHGYLPWALGVTVVALAEEALLRGSLFTALEDRANTATAVAVTSVLFALVHVPLYGTSVLPLDLAVGVWLSVLRAASGSVTVPAIAHTLADLAGWWLR